MKDLDKKKYRLYETLFESFTHPLHVINANTYCVELANAAARNDQYKEGIKCHQLTHHSDEPCQEPDHECVLMRVKESGKPFTCEHLHFNPQGEEYYVEVTGFPIFDEKGKVEKVIEFAMDITARKREEEERLNLQEKIQLSQKFESLNTLAGSIAHHFNNILSGVLGNLELTLDTLKEEGKMKSRLLKAQQSAFKAAELSKLMLTYLGTDQFNMEPLDIGSVFHRYADYLRDLTVGNIQLDIDIASESFLIHGNEEKIKLLFVNLISNAVEAIEAKEILKGHIQVKVSHKTCDESCQEKDFIQGIPGFGQYVKVEFTDNGCGIEKDIQKKVFDPFFTTKFMGRGMGLSVVLGIMKAHNGVVRLMSIPGESTTIVLLFPLIHS